MEESHCWLRIAEGCQQLWQRRWQPGRRWQRRWWRRRRRGRRVDWGCGPSWGGLSDTNGSRSESNSLSESDQPALTPTSWGKYEPDLSFFEAIDEKVAVDKRIRKVEHYQNWDQILSAKNIFFENRQREPLYDQKLIKQGEFFVLFTWCERTWSNKDIKYW